MLWIVGLDEINESLWIVHHLLSFLPLKVFLFSLKHEHTLSDLNASSGWVGKGLQFLNRSLSQTVYSLLGSLHSWNSFGQFSLGLGLLLVSHSGGLISLVLLDLGLVLLDLGDFTLLPDVFNENIGVLLLDLDVLHLDDEQLLESIDLLGGVLHSLQTYFESVNLVRDLVSLLAKQVLVELDQF
jgi:hypothetical protein